MSSVEVKPLDGMAGRMAWTGVVLGERIEDLQITLNRDAGDSWSLGLPIHMFFEVTRRLQRNPDGSVAVTQL